MDAPDLTRRLCFLEPLNSRETVFLARDEATGTLLTARQLSAAQTQPYRKLMAHPVAHVPAVRAIQQDAGDQYLVCTDYIPGTTLEAYLAEQGPLPAETAVELAIQLCDTLEGLQALGMVHRDIKPANLILTEQRELYLIDFDISRLEKPDQQQDTRTLGTAGYAAPEQFGFGQTDRRADLYALGVLLNVMVTGAFPRQKAAPGALGEVVARCIQMDPKDRYAAPGELRAALRRLLPNRRAARVRKAALFVLAAVLLAASCAVALESAASLLAVLYLWAAGGGWLLFLTDRFGLRSKCRFVKPDPARPENRRRLWLLLAGWAAGLLVVLALVLDLLGLA